MTYTIKHQETDEYFTGFDFNKIPTFSKRVEDARTYHDSLDALTQSYLLSRYNKLHVTPEEL